MMRSNRTVCALFCALLGLVLSGCGDDTGTFPYSNSPGDDGRNGRGDAGGNPSLDVDPGADAGGDADEVSDVDPGADAGAETGTEPLPSGCDRAGFEVANVQVTADGSNATFIAVTATAPPYDLLNISSLSDWSGPTTPGTYSLDGINYRDCGLCLLAYSDCTTDACAKTFYADAGDVVIDEIGFTEGEAFAGVLRDVVFREVTIAEDFTSTPVPGGETWCMNDLSFSGFSQSAPQAGECDSNRYDCVGESVSSFELRSCESGEMVNVAELNAAHAGTWMILTAGWCSACHAWLPQVFDALDGELASADVNLMVVLGEDQNGGPPSLDYCRGYANQYGHGLESFYLDNSGGQSYATVFENVWIYPGDGGSFGLPWNGMFRGDTGEYVYADGAGTGDVNIGLNAMLSP